MHEHLTHNTHGTLPRMCMQVRWSRPSFPSHVLGQLFLFLLKRVWAKGSNFMREGSSGAFEQDGTLAIHVKAGFSGFTSHKEKGATQYT